jgi:trimethylamine--corrinoid protein Co-methyltransferase
MKRSQHAGRVAQCGAGLQLFTEGDLDQIHLATLQVLERTGVWVEDDEAFDILSDGGCRLNRETRIAKFPPHIVEELIRAVPSSLTLYGRTPGHDVVLESNRINFCNHVDCVKVIDPVTLAVRPPVLQDVADAALIVDYLSDIEVLLPAAVPSDRPVEALVHEYHASLLNCAKPIHMPVVNRRETEIIIDMAAAVAGGYDELRERPMLSFGPCPVPPLKLPRDFTDVVIAAVRAGVPIFTMNMALAGATGPATMAGTLVIQNALVLAGMAFSEMVERGAKAWYGSATSGMDMRFGLATGGSPEQALLSAGAAQMAQYYGLPNQVVGLWTDSKTCDQQAGHEKTLGALTAALAGSNLIEGAGMIESGLTQDIAQLVIDNDIARMVRKVVDGIPVSDETLLLDEIHAMGPQGDFMSSESTLKHARSMSVPTVLDRHSREEWEIESADLAMRARVEALRIVAEHKPVPLPNDVVEQLDAMLADAVATA